ncbi:hypothetical protein [Bordetella genomosp. 5]|uniref:hypothetical protein n=1 Tax=Bordetella genomosp. 5 TaxID=1395608 RepID=UPI00113FCCB1|nr:hypothetical protein [Bordetella genomosp. 5]
MAVAGPLAVTVALVDAKDEGAAAFYRKYGVCLTAGRQPAEALYDGKGRPQGNRSVDPIVVVTRARDHCLAPSWATHLDYTDKADAKKPAVLARYRLLPTVFFQHH